MAEAVKIRAASAEDLPFLWEMLYEAIYVPVGEPKPPRAILRRPALLHYLEDFGRPGDVGLVAARRNLPVGAVWCRHFSRSDPGYGFVAEEIPELTLAVTPTCRGRGIGTSLLARLLTHLQRCGEKGASLSVQPANPALRLYQRFGFACVGHVEDAWVMVKYFPTGEAN
jgi:ribosomal-protein-alanine N-acetyltransferase